MNISYTHHRLGNGLDVLIHEDRACPIVAVNVWYHVGSKNETPGRTGFAHLFEHLMFEGSEHYDRGSSAAAGGGRAAERIDERRPHELLGGGAAQRAQARALDGIQSNGYLLPALTDAKFENQREVVLNERRQNYNGRRLIRLATVVENDLALVLEPRQRRQQRTHSIGFRRARARARSRHHLPVVRAVAVRQSVQQRARLLQRLEEPAIVVLRTLEHQMLEQVREPRAPQRRSSNPT